MGWHRALSAPQVMAEAIQLDGGLITLIVIFFIGAALAFSFIIAVLVAIAFAAGRGNSSARTATVIIGFLAVVKALIDTQYAYLFFVVVLASSFALAYSHKDRGPWPRDGVWPNRKRGTIFVDGSELQRSDSPERAEE